MCGSFNGNLVGIALLLFGPVPAHGCFNGFNGEANIEIGEDPAVRGKQVLYQKVAEMGIETKRARIVVQNVAQQGQGKLPALWGTGPPAESIERKCFEVGTGWKGRAS